MRLEVEDLRYTSSRARARLPTELRQALARYLSLALFLGFLNTPSPAQSPTDGAVHGFALDAQALAVPGAKVALANSSTGFYRELKASRSGEFLLAGLPAADYVLIIEAPGLRRLVLPHILVELGGTTEITSLLPPAAFTTAITVTAEDEGSNSPEEGGASSTTSAVLTAHEIESLPVDGRRWQTFALLTPEANPDADDLGLLSFRGLASTQNSSNVDGATDDQSYGATPRGSGTESGTETEDEAEGETGDTADRSFEAGAGPGRHAGAAYTFSQAAVEQFRVSGQNYSALYGHASGGVISTVSKSGSNDLHGSVFYLLRTSALAATNPFSVATSYTDRVVSTQFVKPHDLRQQFGFSLGAPLRRDKIFFFVASDTQRRNFPAVSSPAYAGFYNLTATQTTLLANRGVTAGKVNTALNYLSSLSGRVPRQANQTVNFAKIDWQQTARNHFSLQYNRARTSSPAGVRQAPVVSRGVSSLGSNSLHVDSVLARWLWSRSARFSNDLRLQYARDLQAEQPQTPAPQEAAVGPGGFAPEISIGPQGFIFGTPASLGRRAYPDEHRYEFADNVTLALGRHLLQAGADVSLLHDAVDSLSNREGTFQYDSGIGNGRAGGLVDWITDFTFDVHAPRSGGCPSINAALHYFCYHSYTQSFGGQSVAFHTQEWAAFLQDSWRIRRGLTLSAGLRYEYELLPFPQKPNFLLDRTFGSRGATSIFPEDRNNLGPRASLAWEPLGSGRGLIRIAYGLYFGRLPGATVRSALINTAQPSSTTRIRLFPTTIAACPQVPTNGFGYVCSYLAQPPSAVGATTSAMVFDRRFRLPAIQQGSFSLERDIAAGITTSATYLLNLDRQLPSSVDINVLPSTGTRVFQLQGGAGSSFVRDGVTFAVPFYSQRANTSFGPVTDITSSVNGTYNALVLEARRRSRGGLDLRVSWTWSKAIDDGESSGAVPRTNTQFDPYTNRYDKALSSLNFPHKVVASAVWRPSVRSENPWIAHALNGWLLAPVFSEHSGKPFSYDIFGGSRLTGGHESINGSGGAAYLPSVGRNVLRMPDTFHLDVRINREIPLSDSVHLKLFTEVFNLPNHINYTGVTRRAFLAGTLANGVTPLVFQDAPTVAAEGLNTRPFGAFTASSTGQARERQLQFGLRLEF